MNGITVCYGDREHREAHYLIAMPACVCGTFKASEYRLYNTNIHEKIAELNKRELQNKIVVD